VKRYGNRYYGPGNVDYEYDALVEDRLLEERELKVASPIPQDCKNYRAPTFMRSLAALAQEEAPGIFLALLLACLIVDRLS
jgi:hypothetical protein